MGKMSTSICVKYKHAEGWHVFTSDDIYGLYVASKDPELAFSDVSLAIEKLLKLNEGIECRVEPELTFSEFLREIRANSKKKPKPEIVGLSSRLFSVYPVSVAA